MGYLISGDSEKQEGTLGLKGKTLVEIVYKYLVIRSKSAREVHRKRDVFRKIKSLFYFEVLITPNSFFHCD
jgi:hypothetical protein